MLVRLLIFLIGVLSLCVNTTAADKVQVNAAPSWLYKTTPDFTKKPKSKDISGGYYYDLLDRQVNLTNNTEYSRIIIQIENETGVQNASEVSVTFSPSFQQLVFHQVIVWRKDNAVTTLKPGDIQVVQEETDAYDFQYNGQKRAFIILKDVRKGDKIEYAYSLIGFNPVFGNRYSDKIYFSFNTPILNYFETLIVPAARKLFITSFNGGPKPSEEVTGANKVYRWNNPGMQRYEFPSGVPSWYEDFPFTMISEYESWQEVINWGVKLFNGYKYELPAGLKNKISQWRKQANGDRDIFANLALQFVQDDVRYLGLEIGMHTHKPHTPSEVYNRRFGDCKDKALLLSVILQQENIPAYVALVNTKKRSKLTDAPPSPAVFDHAIVAIERSGYIFVDPTISLQRGELVNRFVPAYGYALIVRDSESTLKTVEPGFVYNSNVVERLKVSYDDTSRLSVSSTFAGGSADDFRSMADESALSDLEKNYITFYEKLFEGIEQEDQLLISDDSLKNEIQVTEFYRIPRLTKTDDKGRQKFEVFAKLMYDQLPNPADKKDVPLAINYPASLQYSLEMVMPDKTSLEMLPVFVSNEAFEFSFTPETSGNQITLHYSFKSMKDHIPTSELTQYRHDYEKIMNVLQVEFTHSGNVLSAGDNANAGYGINWRMVFLVVVLVAVLGFTLKKLNQLHVEPMYEPGTGWPIGGWLVLLGIGLAVSSIFQIYQFATNNYFSYTAWTMLGQSAGPLLQLTLLMEVVLSLVWLCGTIALLYWFLNRRDIFPKVFIWYVGSLIAGKLLLLILYNCTPNPDPAYNDTLRIDLVSRVFYALIWGTYVWRADRVKCTFTEPV